MNMMMEPSVKQVYVFMDGQNLYRAAKDAFGYHHPNYDPALLAKKVCSSRGWNLKEIYFYTGIPDAQDDPFWHHFWAAKLAVMGTRGIHSFTRPLRYHNEVVTIPGGGTTSVLVGREKGVDVRLALDVVRFAREGRFDVGVIFSQDQDLSEVAVEIRSISTEQNRWIKIASAYPVSPTYLNRRGINKTDWILIDRPLYDACLDPTDYRPKKRKA